MATSYFYLRPGVFSAAEEQAESVDMAEADIAPRAVTPEEALDGVGTFVVGVICISWVRPGGARVWYYGCHRNFKPLAASKQARAFAPHRSGLLAQQARGGPDNGPL
ncbi:hypothetical protein ON010_g4102 [Phytophthora cinnamomi]|nr:hypothetical protein ON010_g4102 [Phytophthora cinnamomi]